MCTLSIIIPTYNSEATINACLKSVAMQKFEDYEVLVIDGLSADGTIEIVNGFCLKMAIRLLSEKDNGIFDAMNKGIELARGTWLYFLGSDDELNNEDVLNQVHSQIKSHQNSLMLYGDVIASDGTLERYVDYTYDKLLGRCICHQSIFYHRSLFKALQYDTRFKVCADWDLNLKLFKKRIHPVYTNLVVAKFNLGGVSGRWWEHPEYVDNFSNKKLMALRYRGPFYFFNYMLRKLFSLLAGPKHEYFNYNTVL